MNDAERHEQTVEKESAIPQTAAIPLFKLERFGKVINRLPLDLPEVIAMILLPRLIDQILQVRHIRCSNGFLQDGQMNGGNFLQGTVNNKESSFDTGFPRWLMHDHIQRLPFFLKQVPPSLGRTFREFKIDLIDRLGYCSTCALHLLPRFPRLLSIERHNPYWLYWRS